MKTIYKFGQGMDQGTINDIKECIDNILRIPEGSVPLARELGTSWRKLSEITPDIENEYAVELVEKIEKYEPRVAIESITFDHEQSNGEIVVRIVFDGGDDDE